MAKKAVSPSNETITKEQASKFADLLTTDLAKSDLPSEGTQRVLEQYGVALASDFIALVRERVEAEAKIIRHTVAVDGSLPPEAVIKATGRKQCINNDVVATMPRSEGDSVIIEFIPLEKRMNNEAVDQLLAEHGLIAVDLFALAAHNTADPDFATACPCFTHWQDAKGNWCFAAFYDWLDEQRVYVSRRQDAWSGRWWVAGVRK